MPSASKSSDTATRKVTFDATTNGGTCSTASLNSTATITYSQTGWWTAASGGTNRGAAGAKYTPSASEKIYAQFSSSTGTYSKVTLPAATKASTTSTRTVTFNANQGTTTKTSQNSTATVTYSQTGWWTAASGGTNRGNASAQYTPSAAETLYAQFSSSTGTYSAVTLPTTAQCTRTGYTLLGWSTSSSATSATYSPGASYTPDATRTLYAVWQLNTYTISYAANGGSSTPSSQTKTYGVNLTIAAAISRNNSTSNGYTVTFNANGGSTTKSSQTAINTTTYSFKNWKSSATGATWAAGATNFNEDNTTTLTAQWNSSTTNGSVTLPTTSECTRANYILKGFATSDTATTPTYNPGAVYTPTADIILYAVWELDQAVV